jgi:hypothetical protein
MIFRAFSYFDTGCASYLFGCGSLGKCVVVDPRADDVQSYQDFATAKGMQITDPVAVNSRRRRARRTACMNRPTSFFHSHRCAMATRLNLETRASACFTLQDTRRKACASWLRT